MLVAITQKSNLNRYNERVDLLENNYITFLENFGIKLIAISNCTKNINYYFDNFPIEGIILTGGEDISPKEYGQDFDWPNTSSLRDSTEKKLMEIAVEKKMPVLGICRGLQIINVFFGGKLIKNITEEIREHPTATDHSLKIINNLSSQLSEDKIRVNSYHNQGVTSKTLSSSLNMFATTEDEKLNERLVEGLFHPTLPIVGIQWHPERKSPNQEFNTKLMKAFVNRKLFWEEKFKDKF